MTLLGGCGGTRGASSRKKQKEGRCGVSGGKAIDRVSINLLEVTAMVVTAYVIVVMKEDRPDKEGAAMLLRGDNLSAVQSVIEC